MLGLLPLTTGFGLPTRHTMCVFLRCRFHIGLGIVQVCPIIAFCLATSLLTPASSDYQFREKRRMKHGPGKWWRRFYGGVIGVFAIVWLQSTLTSMLRQKMSWAQPKAKNHPAESHVCRENLSYTISICTSSSFLHLNRHGYIIASPTLRN